MTLLLFVITALVIGYFLARGKYSQSIDETAGKVAASSRNWSNRAEGWWQSRIRQSSLADPFREWAAGMGADHLPEDFKTWLDGLSNQEASVFTTALDSYSADLGYSLEELVHGEYDNKPALMQIFVEAIVVYSQEFRKAKEVDNNQTQDQPDSESEDIKPAEKQSSRRRKSSPVESAEAAA